MIEKQKCHKKQAIYINSLSHINNLNRPNYKGDLIIPYEKALKYTYSEAKNKIKQLRDRVSYIMKVDEKRLKKVPRPVYFENYIKVKKVRADMRNIKGYGKKKKYINDNDMILEIETTQGKKIEVKKKDTAYLSQYDTLTIYEKIRESINRDKQIVIGMRDYGLAYKEKHRQLILEIEDETQEEKEKKRELAKIMREILDYTGGYILVDKDHLVKENTVRSIQAIENIKQSGPFEELVRMIHFRNILLYDKIIQVANKYSLDEIRLTSAYANSNVYGYYRENQNLTAL